MLATIPINTKSNTTTTTPAMQMEIIPHTRPAFTFLNEDSVYSSGDCKYSFRCPGQDYGNDPQYQTEEPVTPTKYQGQNSQNQYDRRIGQVLFRSIHYFHNTLIIKFIFCFLFLPSLLISSSVYRLVH